MFVGRENELATLTKAWQSDDFQFIVMYGRRRVGKSMLLTHFAKDKRAIYHLAQETSPKTALEQFSRTVSSFTGQTGLHFTDWSEALLYIARLSKTERLLLIIDEFPYLAETDKSLLSLLQNTIDTQLSDCSLFLVLCGSTIGFMERKVLGAKSPLFGRRTGQMRLEPFDYLTGAEFVSGYSNIDKVLTYCLFGGIPHYLARLDDTIPLTANVLNTVLQPHAYLYDEPVLLLKQELREPSVYNAVIEAIASGASRLNEIATHVGEDISKCGKYLRTLIELGFVTREVPIGSKANGRKTIYSICDPFFVFWYVFVFPHRSVLEKGLADYILETEVLPRMNDHTGRLFERICIEFLHRENKRKALPFVFLQIGRWWGTDNKQKRQVELDIVALGKGEALICECKWRNDPVDLSVLNNFINNSEAYPCTRKTLALFSKSGFTPAVNEEAQKRNILLYNLDDLYVEK